MTAPALEVIDLALTFATERGPLRVLDGISFALPAGRTTALVGESGCGKSVAALAVIGPVFVHGIASRTLAGLKAAAERGA